MHLASPAPGLTDALALAAAKGHTRMRHAPCQTILDCRPPSSPMHLRLPPPKGRYLKSWVVSLGTGWSSGKRSGLKASASSHSSGDLRGGQADKQGAGVSRPLCRAGVSSRPLCMGWLARQPLPGKLLLLPARCACQRSATTSSPVQVPGGDEDVGALGHLVAAQLVVFQRAPDDREKQGAWRGVVSTEGVRSRLGRKTKGAWRAQSALTAAQLAPRSLALLCSTGRA